MVNPSFGDAIAGLYEQYMVPMVFEPFADDLVSRLSASRLGNVLETAAGTGIVTRKLATLHANAPSTIIATDVSEAMVSLGREICPDRLINWRQMDAASLSFPDATFDTIVCQFGAMFFKDRVQAYREARRVLRPGGRFVFNVWERIDANEFVHTVSKAVGELFPENPPDFFRRVPHGYFHTSEIAADLAMAGFDAPAFEMVSKVSIASSAAIPAHAYIEGTPIRGEIEQRDASLIESAVHRAERALRDRFGQGPIEGGMQAIVVTVSH